MGQGHLCKTECCCHYKWPNLLFWGLLDWGTKQGDPLFPLLFILFLEQLAIALRKEAKIKGEIEHKLFSFADDILCLVSDPTPSAQALVDTIETFSQIQYLAIKSIGINQRLCLYQRLVIQQWSGLASLSGSHRVKYLRVKLYANIADVMHINMKPLLIKNKA